MGGQAINFVIFTFIGKVTCRPAGQANLLIYKVEDLAKLDVVTELAGQLWTYEFNLGQQDHVYVDNDVIHVSQNCVAVKEGNTIQCEGDR